MSPKSVKAVNTRRERLSKAFESEFNRPPTITELNDLYSEEMRRIGSKSSRNKGGVGGFHHMKINDPDKFREITSKGGRGK